MARPGAWVGTDLFRKKMPVRKACLISLFIFGCGLRLRIHDMKNNLTLSSDRDERLQGNPTIISDSHSM